MNELLISDTGKARAADLVRELLLSDTGKAKAAGLVRELLVTTGSTSPATRAYVGGLEREALVAPPQTTRLRPYLLINA